MSYLEELLNEDNLVWKPLGEISEIYGGLTGKSKADFEKGNAKYISYKNIFFNLNVKCDILETVKITESEKQHEVKYGDVLFTGSSETPEEVGMSSAVTTNIDEPVYLNSFSFGVRFNKEIKLIPEFSKYLFRSKFMRSEISKTASGVTRYNVSKARFKKLNIPIPPLSVQKEIVRILDKFTELTAELTARKKQYIFYREQFFEFAAEEIQREAIGVIGEFKRGKRFVKDDMLSEGVPCIHYGEMYTHYGTWANKSKSFLSEELVERKKLRIAEHGDIVIVAAGETIEDIGLGTAWLGDEGVVIHDACFSFRSPLNPKYVAYFTRTKQFHDQIKKHISSGKISAINARGLEKVLIPVPSPEEQERIVTILDEFDTVTTSITESLPKEIEFRKKQYEYYRDLLLNFPQIETT